MVNIITTDACIPDKIYLNFSEVYSLNKKSLIVNLILKFVLESVNLWTYAFEYSRSFAVLRLH